MKPRSIILLLIPAILLAGLLLPGSPLIATAINQAIKYKFPDVRQVTPEDLVIWWRSPDRTPPLLIDARSPAEFRVSHIKDAVSIDPEAPDLTSLVNFRRTHPVVVYDAAGIRGVAMAEALRQQGYTDVSNLSGGIFRWANEGRELVNDTGPVTVVHPWRGLWSQLLKSRYRAQPGQ
ncbi:MAG: rhodanese-like domain-containing protein [Gemmatimonadota bacterium]